MAKTTTFFKSSGASKHSNQNKLVTHKTMPSQDAVRFVLNYAKSSTVLKTKAIDSFVFLSN